MSANLRRIAHTLLLEYELCGKYANLLLSSHKADGLSPAERGILTSLLYTTVERKLTLDYAISTLAKRPTEKIDISTLCLLRLGLCQLFYMDAVPDFAAVNETVKLSKNPGERAFVNGVLRAAARLEGVVPTPDESKNYRRYLSVKYSFPLPLVKHFDALFGRVRCEKMLAFYNGAHYTDILVNTLKISVEDYTAALCAREIPYEKNGVCGQSLRINSSISPERLFGFREGYFTVQDRSSTMASLTLGLEPCEKMLDVCAAPGGKSIAAAIFSQDKAEITSLDIHENKLSLIKRNAERLGICSIGCYANDASVEREEYYGAFDKVLCDVPCSGLGVLSKKPDLRYKDLSGLDTLPTLQYSILKASAKYLKTGGALVYSTCTLNPRENEEIVERFIAEHPDFELCEFEVGEYKSQKGMITVYPDIHNSDGFFVSKIIRKK